MAVQHAPIPSVQPNAVFLNIPYDDRFRRQYLAYIVGLTQLGLEPRATLGIAGGERRLDRILALIQGCRYSIHDLSRIEIDRTPPPTPRFNMPCELGMTITWQKLNASRHTWFVFESRQRRLQKSLSDLNGTDVNIHGGTVEGVMRELSNAFVRRGPQPGVPEMMRTYRRVVGQLDGVFQAAGTRDLFSARVFKDVCFIARANASGS
jgi:hypothetical protein